jgi:hypothetical protein
MSERESTFYSFFFDCRVLLRVVTCLLEMWVSYESTGGLPKPLLGSPTEEEVAGYYGVTVAAIRKLAAFGYLSLLDRGDRREVVPLVLAIRRVGHGVFRLF